MKFEQVEESVLYADDRVTVAKGAFISPEGQRFERQVVRLPGAVCAVPVSDHNDVSDIEVTMVRQYRSALDSHLLEIPAGRRDVLDEPLEVTASRELLEEVGLSASNMSPLCNYFSSPGFCDEEVFIFLAEGLKAVGSIPQGIEERHMTIERIRLSAVPELIAAGEINDAKTIIGLLIAKQVLELRSAS